MISKKFTILILVLSLLWFGMALASISVEDEFIFHCTESCSLTEEVLTFFRSDQSPSSRTYDITVNSTGDFSIDQNEIYKFKIDSSGNVNWVGPLMEGGFDFKEILASTSCSSGFAYGIDSNGWLCVDDCNDDCNALFGATNRTCDIISGRQNCQVCTYCNGTNLACVSETAGEQVGCDTSCKRCDGSGACVAFTNDIQDSEGSNLCNGFCQACQGGACGYASTNADPGGDCGTTLCYTGNCNGAGGCNAYNDGAIHNCGVCQYCADTDASCENRVAGYYDARCGPCKTCLGTGTTCKVESTMWNVDLYGCTVSNARCVDGTCRGCGGSLYNDNCDGCAGQGGLACWYTAPQGGAPNATCAEFCSAYAHGGCVAAGWNDDTSCSVLIALGHGCTRGCVKDYYIFDPRSEAVLLGGNKCSYRNASSPQDCWGWWLGMWRICVCNY